MQSIQHLTVKLAAKPLMDVPREGRFRFGGFVGKRIIANQENWLLRAPLANPGMLQMFRDRDHKPQRGLVPWAGEFPGKYLISAVQGYFLTRDRRLYQLLEKFVCNFFSVQDTDGYLGPHPKSQRLTGETHDGKQALWDLWGHYHCILGLLYWWQETGDQTALKAACKAADLICNHFLNTDARATNAGAEEMNLLDHISSPYGFASLDGHMPQKHHSMNAGFGTCRPGPILSFAVNGRMAMSSNLPSTSPFISGLVNVKCRTMCLCIEAPFCLLMTKGLT